MLETNFRPPFHPLRDKEGERTSFLIDKSMFTLVYIPVIQTTFNEKKPFLTAWVLDFFIVVYLKIMLYTKNELERTPFIPPTIFRISRFDEK